MKRFHPAYFLIIDVDDEYFIGGVLFKCIIRTSV